MKEIIREFKGYEKRKAFEIYSVSGNLGGKRCGNVKNVVQ